MFGGVTHRIHVWYIYANIWGILMGSMLPYIAYMDPMGYIVPLSIRSIALVYSRSNCARSRHSGNPTLHWLPCLVSVDVDSMGSRSVPPIPHMSLIGSSESITGWWCNNHLEKYEFVNGKDYHLVMFNMKYIMENKTCSKPPTRSDSNHHLDVKTTAPNLAKLLYRLWWCCNFRTHNDNHLLHRTVHPWTPNCCEKKKQRLFPHPKSISSTAL